MKSIKLLRIELELESFQPSTQHRPTNRTVDIFGRESLVRCIFILFVVDSYFSCKVTLL